jgi:tRNA-specific 2-thiouridylase
MMPRRRRVIVGMSGGVDSSVAAWMLKQQGYEVLGLFMKNWEDDDTGDYCTSRVDLVDAAAVADVIGIDLEAVNFAAEYRERVFARFLREYEAGRTPNPDVLCNSEIKFRAFLDHSRNLGGDHIATGHYARVRTTAQGVLLLKAADASKDQSYFLHQLTQEQLAPVLFPLGETAKRDVRAIARREGIPTWAKKDSTGICFIGERPFRDFLARYLPRTPGPIETTDGRVIGSHHGVAYYTLGQRQGLRIGGTRDGADLPWFVAAKDFARNALIAVQGHDHPLLFRTTVDAHAMHWIAGTPPDPRALAALGAKTRYRMPDAACRIDLQPGELCRAAFAEPQWAPTPGQYLVLYDGEVCLGGGVISEETAAAAREVRSPGCAQAKTRAAPAVGPVRAECRDHPGFACAQPGLRGKITRGFDQNGMSSSKSSAAGLLPPPPDLAPPLGAGASRRPPLLPANSVSPPLPVPPSRPPSSCMRSATISVAYFSTPSLSVYLRVCRRPSM